MIVHSSPGFMTYIQATIIIIINFYGAYKGGSRGLEVKVLDSKFEGCEFKTHTRLPYFASVYSAANEYKHCLEGTCDGLVSCPGESV